MDAHIVHTRFMPRASSEISAHGEKVWSHASNFRSGRHTSTVSGFRALTESGAEPIRTSTGYSGQYQTLIKDAGSDPASVVTLYLGELPVHRHTGMGTTVYYCIALIIMVLDCWILGSPCSISRS